MKLLAFAVIAALAAPAAAETYKIDPVHSAVTFKIRHFVSKVNGRFKKFEGTFDYAKGKMDAWNTQATIDVASIDTDNDRRDNHLRSPDFFDAQRCPNIEFKSSKIEKSKTGKSIQMKGELTMHCVTRPVWLTLEVGEPMADKMGASLHGKIDRKDFGIVWNKVLDKGGTMLGDDVEISIDVEGGPAAPEAAKKG